VRYRLFAQRPITSSARIMNEQPSHYSLAFSYLLIPVITGILVTGTTSDRIDIHDFMEAGKYTNADNIAIINAEASLPIYAASQAHSSTYDPAARRDAVVINEFTTGAPVTTTPDDHDTWHIHIASLTNRDEADRIVQYAGENGIAAIQNTVVVNGVQFRRVSVIDTHSYGEAKRHADRIKDQLGLKDAWISKASKE